jgi:hypothetical protein
LADFWKETVWLKEGIALVKSRVLREAWLMTGGHKDCSQDDGLYRVSVHLEVSPSQLKADKLTQNFVTSDYLTNFMKLSAS